MLFIFLTLLEFGVVKYLKSEGNRTTPGKWITPAILRPDQRRTTNNFKSKSLPTRRTVRSEGISSLATNSSRFTDYSRYAAGLSNYTTDELPSTMSFNYLDQRPVTFNRNLNSNYLQINRLPVQMSSNSESYSDASYASIANTRNEVNRRNTNLSKRMDQSILPLTASARLTPKPLYINTHQDLTPKVNSWLNERTGTRGPNFKKSPKTDLSEPINWSNRIDSCSKFLFPVTFFLFNIVYWFIII